MLAAWSDPRQEVIVAMAVLTPAWDVLRVRIVVDGEVKEEPVALEWTPCRFGGERPWFRCRGCGKRKVVLFSTDGWFDCASCLGVVYASTREGVVRRAERRSDMLRERLRRRGLHGPTVGKLVRELAKHDAILDDRLAAFRQYADEQFRRLAIEARDDPDEIERQVEVQMREKAGERRVRPKPPRGLLVHFSDVTNDGEA